jgi:undecaprenyl-diphosphatase
MGIDAAARPLTGEAPGIAWLLTASCLWPTLTTFGVIAVRNRQWRGRIVFAIGTTLVGWLTSNVLKDIFARPRPAYWIVRHETTLAYSSGHAMFATLVYWLWAYHVARSCARPGLKLPLGVGLALWGAGVMWSRLALGAHYPSDLAGGVLLGVALLALARLVATAVAPTARVL